MTIEQIGRQKLEKIAGESPELQAIYLKKFEEIEKRILIGEVTWDEMENLIYEALISSEEVQKIAIDFLRRRVEESRKKIYKSTIIFKRRRIRICIPILNER